MAENNRSITFTMDGRAGKSSLIINVVEMDDGTLKFEYSVVGDGELRGLFFDFNNESIIDSLGLLGSQITNQQFKNEGVTNLRDGNNMNGTGEKFDVGATFGGSGVGRDQTTEGSFVLFSNDGTALTLHDIANVTFGARFASDSVKLVTTAPAAPDAIDDLIVASEDFATNEVSAPNSNVLSNDTDADGDTLTVVAVNGDESLVGAQIELATGALVTLNSNGTYDLDPNGEYEDLADGEIRTDSFTYRITDELVDPNNQGFDTATINITINGENDRPIAVDIAAELGEDAAPIIEHFVASDVDTTDILSYQVLAQPLDSLGHQYGEVTNNNDGTFSFDPLDNFQFLEAGESRIVTFQYVAIDDSGTATDTSAPKTATITVHGAYDEPIEIETELLFESNDQSMWQSGGAFQIDWREFYGTQWNDSFSETIVSKETITLVPKITDPILGETIYDGLKASSPSVSIGGGSTGRIGISPYFVVDSGSVDTQIPVDIDLSYEVQYEDGDTVIISTGYAIDSTASFDTSSPSVSFGVDLVFEFTAYGNLTIGSSTAGSGGTYSLFPTINIDIDEPDLPGTDYNLFGFSSVSGLTSDVLDIPVEQDGEGGYLINVGESSLNLSLPYIETTGELTGPTRLESTGSDDVAILTLDLDEILSEVTKYVPPMHYEDSVGLDFSFDLPGFVNELGWDDIDIDVFSVNWDFELIDVDLIGTLTAIQDFTLDITELPLMLTLENGDVFTEFTDEFGAVTAFTLGTDIQFDVPDWDVDILGDADGVMDYTISVDMDAMLNNWTTLDFTLDLLTRALKATIGYTSDIVGDDDFSLFGSQNDGFLVAENFDLLDISPIAELFGDEDPEVSGFELLGFNTAVYADSFDIA